jgi:hypothetical protein
MISWRQNQGIKSGHGDLWDLFLWLTKEQGHVCSFLPCLGDDHPHFIFYDYALNSEKVMAAELTQA